MRRCRRIIRGAGVTREGGRRGDSDSCRIGGAEDSGEATRVRASLATLTAVLAAIVPRRTTNHNVMKENGPWGSRRYRSSRQCRGWVYGCCSGAGAGGRHSSGGSGVHIVRSLLFA